MPRINPSSSGGSGGSPEGPAGGVLAGTYPNPAFANGMATDAELDAVADAKADIDHGHAIGDVTGLQASLDGKAASSHTHTKSQITDFAHTHPQSDITSLVSDLAAKQAVSEKAQANGYASLDGTGKVPSGQLPAGSVTVREETAAQWDTSQTKTNIGTAFVDVYVGANSDGKSMFVDFDGKTQFRLVVNWNKIGTGTQTVQVVDASNVNNVLGTLDVVSGNNTGTLTALPAWATGQKRLKVRAKSTVAADDPVFESAQILLK